MAEQYQEPFIYDLERAVNTTEQDDPNYYARLPRSLITASNIQTFISGTGSSIYEDLSPLLEDTEHELILVTCFWASSVSRDVLNAVLRKLSDKAIRRGTEKIRVRICFSSSSVFQKLFHKQAASGQTYLASEWVKKFGLPDPSELGGLDLKIKSVFILPFSVMHPKFIIVDRQVVVLPSCNVSWEEWFEGAITMTGPILSQFLRFYWAFWERRADAPPDLPDRKRIITVPATDRDAPPGVPSARHTAAGFPDDTPSFFLPSPHHWNPNFRLFGAATAPTTPLNAFLLTLFDKAEHSIRIQTPNLTAPPVLSALLRALARGIDVKILTSARLMILEQLVTAGTTTYRCVKTLIKRYKALEPRATSRIHDEEAAMTPAKVGKLRISYFEPRHGYKKKGEEQGEPQQSHLKMTIVDGEVLVLGSGNLDRASWSTSQELGVAFFGAEVVRKVEETVDTAMAGRSRVVFDSETR
ncbi:phospholipase D/nuclease [Macroventuria anomochaeta]|uniref:Phospholipase D/nuclease n=1 Tax=Macroventuria anomochaeta TaxID=301207 RepID=A0ACB6RH42_9PLEO|nr:phospholipase D/nuclease [Macroventuria anomochaeta]KAF2621191.1 phospholipase D/nuclease [Macroventuria anomochaeta]